MMSNSNDPPPPPPPAPQPSGPPPDPPPSPPAAADLERGAAKGSGVSDIMDRWKKQELLKRGSSAARAVCFFCSFLAFVIMGTNSHGDWREYDHYEEYRYVVTVSFVSALYTGIQSWRHLHELSTSNEVFSISSQNLAVVDFGGDQVIAYMLVSAASSAIPLTNRMREGSDNMFTDASAAAITTTIFAFVSLALSSLISGYKLSKQSHI